MYGGCTGDVRLDIVQIPYGYRTDITEPLPLDLAENLMLARGWRSVQAYIAIARGP